MDLSGKKNEFAKQYRLWLGLKISLPLIMDLPFHLLEQ